MKVFAPLPGEALPETEEGFEDLCSDPTLPESTEVVRKILRFGVPNAVVTALTEQQRQDFLRLLDSVSPVLEEAASMDRRVRTLFQTHVLAYCCGVDDQQERDQQTKERLRVVYGESEDGA